MLRLEIDGERFRIGFCHEKVADVAHGLASRKTTCKIWRWEESAEEPLMVGVAYCSKKDNFKKESGRKLSFARAIAEFTKGERAQAWNWYRRREVATGWRSVQPDRAVHSQVFACKF